MNPAKVSIIMCIYNTLPVVAKSIEALLARMATHSFWELILVDNHSPDEKAREFIREVASSSGAIKVVDPGKNIGCHDGWNFGYKHTNPKNPFVVKIDDDTVIKTWGWHEKMGEILANNEDLVYVCTDLDAKFSYPYHVKVFNGWDDRKIDGQVCDEGMWGFSMVMFKRDWIDKLGGLKVGRPVAKDAGGKSGPTELIEIEGRLYGGEELYCARSAHDEGKVFCCLPSVFCHHQGNEERHPDYPQWKFSYGYMGWTALPLMEWIKSSECERDYMRRILSEVSTAEQGLRPINDVILRDCFNRLKEVGGMKGFPDLIKIVDKVAVLTDNGVVLEAATGALDAIKIRSDDEQPHV